MSEQTRRSYRFGPLERRGLLGPLRAGQATAIVLAGLCALLALTSLPGGVGLVTAFGVFGLTLLLTLVPTAGRTGDEWVPLLARFAARRVSGRSRWYSPLPCAGWRSQLSGADRRPPLPGADGSCDRGSLTPLAPGHGDPGALTPPAPVLPPELHGVELIEVEYGNGRIGALAEPGRRRLTGVIACRAAAFALLDPEAQERRLDRWGTLLAGTAEGPIRRMQWLERTVPTRSDQLAHWLNDARDPTIPARGTPIVESYLELISAGARVANAHEILLAIQIEPPRGSGRHAPSLEAALVEQLERVAGALSGAEVTVLGAMMPGPLARSLRSGYDPFGAAEMHDFSSGGGDEIARHEQGPMGTAEAWDHYRSDGASHATFWISDWPRVDVSPMFLDPLLGASRVVRTIAVTMAPVPPARSAREVEAAVTRDHADRELRARLGQTETARQRQMQDWTRRREAELAAGHAELRLSGFVTVSARNTEELRVACDECQQQATQARLGLHRLYGQQAEAFTFTLPLARGLK